MKPVKKIIFVVCMIAGIQTAISDNGSVQQIYQSNYITLDKIFTICNKKDSNSLCLNTTEISTQYYDDLEVFENKRKVEYYIVKNKKEIRIRRKIISSETHKLCDNDKIVSFYPDTSYMLLCSILRPGKMTLEYASKAKVFCSITNNKNNIAIDIDKLKGKEKFKRESMSTSISADAATEQIIFSQHGNKPCLDSLKTIKCRLDETVSKKESTHKITVIEIINIDRSFIHQE